MRIARGTTRVTMLAHQPGVDTSSAVEMEVSSSKASGTADRAVRRELVVAGCPPNTNEGAAQSSTKAAARRVGSSTNLDDMATESLKWVPCYSALGPTLATLPAPTTQALHKACNEIPFQ
ncbi:unnamed protein product [Effrenium voratum]|uniref:Uncharacterized protein n=1 Tax=Effrenium voratum TaxID=2562239 RepID=A0AA36N3W9_9DINO|nr:unnamed protein product [Effrenium voratum]